ncbi:hypothetical protein PENTCL1PPCAC_15587, partial [Pristionchus entomophagus]
GNRHAAPVGCHVGNDHSIESFPHLLADFLKKAAYQKFDIGFITQCPEHNSNDRKELFVMRLESRDEFAVLCEGDFGSNENQLLRILNPHCIRAIAEEEVGQIPADVCCVATRVLSMWSGNALSAR